MKKLFLYTPLALLLLMVAGPLAAQSGFLVVVNSVNPISEMAQVDLSRMFLKKTTYWANGLKVAAVDQTASRPVRESFGREVHGKSISGMKGYWQKMIFSGHSTPPPELASDNEVMNYVRNRSGGIGYVSEGATVGRGLKVLRLSP